MRSTLDDLRIVRKKYRINFERLKTSVGTRLQDKYVKIERRLEKRQIVILKELGLFVPDPCPTQSHKYCWECSGYYVLHRRTRKGVQLCREVSFGTPGAIRCILK